MAGIALRKMDALHGAFAGIRSVLSASANVGHRFPVAAGASKLIADVCVRFRKLLPRHVWLSAAALFVGLLVPTAPVVAQGGATASPPPAPIPCTISSALFSSASKQLGPSVKPPPHVPSQCPKCSVVPHVVAALRQEFHDVTAMVHSPAPHFHPFLPYPRPPPSVVSCFVNQ